MGRKCAVPHCFTGYRKCTEKASLYRVPDDDFFFSKWQEAIAREDRPITPKDYICEKHFKDDDILRKRIRKDVVEEYQRPRLKPDAIPSIFPDLPEFILKMTKKRRKLNAHIPHKTLTDTSTQIEQDKLDPFCNIKEEPQDDNTEDEIAGINTDEINIKTEVEDVPRFLKQVEYDSTGVKLHCCDKCSYKTKFSHNLHTHKVKHLSGENAFMRCELCADYKTKWEITYLNHMKSKHGVILKEYLKCPFCRFKTKNKNFLAKHCEREHENKDNAIKQFKCEVEGCNYQTNTIQLLSIHDFTHNKLQIEEVQYERTFSCKECYFRTTIKGHLLKHVKIVHNINNDKETNYVQKGNNEHTKTVNKTQIINTEQKETKSIKKNTLKCSRCPYRTHSQTLIDKHLLKHQMIPSNDNQNFTNLLTCSKCKYTTFSEISLQEHHKDTFHCNECSYLSKDKSDYIKHTLTHRNTTIEIVVRKPSQDGSCISSNDTKEQPNLIQDFHIVTIKEENLTEES